MSHIFISYSRKDLDFAQKIVDALAADNLDTWTDWKSIPKGEDWEREIYRGIEGADAFLFLISPDSVKSIVCSDEIDHAVKNGKRILPIVIRDVAPGDAQPEISKRNWIFCRGGRDDFSKAIEETRKTIQTDYEWLEYHTRLQVRALEWERVKDASRHLRGKDLHEAEQKLAVSGKKEPLPTDLQRQFVLASRAGETRTRNVVIAVAFTVLIALGVLSIVAVAQRNIAVTESHARGTAQAETEEQRRVAVSRQLAAQAGNTLTNQPDLALLLSLESYNSADTLESRDILLKSLLHKPHLARIFNLESAALSVGFSPNGEYLAAGLSDGSLEIWKTETWERVEVFPGDLGEVKHLSFGREGKTLDAIYCAPPDQYSHVGNCHFLVLDLKTRAATTLSSVDAEWPAAFSADGSVLVFATSSGFQLWDAFEDKPIGSSVSTPPGLGLISLILSPDNHWVIGGGCGSSGETGCASGVIVGWEISKSDLGSQQDPITLGHQGNAVVSLAFDPSGNYLASGSCIQLDALLGNCPGGEAKLWALTEDATAKPTLVQVSRSEFTQSGPVNNLALGYDRRGVLAINGNDNQVSLYIETDFVGLDDPWAGTTFIASKNNIVDTAISPAGHWLAAAGGDSVTLWEIDPAPILEQVLNAPTFGITSMAVTKNNQFIGSDAFGGISSLDLKTGASSQLDLAAQDSIAAMIAPDGTPLGFIGTADGKLPRLFDLKTKQPISPPLDGFPEVGTVGGMPFGAFVISSDHKFLAASGYSQVVLWDLQSSSLAEPLTSTPLDGAAGGMSLAFSHDGKKLASGGETGGITIWNVADRNVIDTVYSGASTPFSALAFTPDDRILAAAVCTRHELTDDGGDICQNSEIRLWDLETRQPFGSPLPTISDYILALGFDAKGEELFAFPYNGSLYEILDFKPANWLRFACQAAGRNFTQAEWQQYFPGEPYRSTCPQYPAGQ